MLWQEVRLNAAVATMRVRNRIMMGVRFGLGSMSSVVKTSIKEESCQPLEEKAHRREPARLCQNGLVLLLAAVHAHVDGRRSRGGLGSAGSEGQGGNGEDEGGEKGFHVDSVESI
jgi:hypothetical protein